MFTFVAFWSLRISGSLEGWLLTVDKVRISISISIYIYIIAEVERKWVPIIKEVLTNKISGYLKFIHISL